MYLKSIKAQGFKSFADKLDLEINPGITGIVGPNGSGKSNIVDAVKWVLGEQSVKSLRGATSMADCIFSGSATREAQKRAMVALTFDNKDKYLNSDFTEVEIKRVVYSTGENEYYINNSRVRLKDITNLFIDSGAGFGAFNIISQGNVTDIVNGKPTERRTIFESAAGVLKYKNRKEESLKKLEKTEENLTRLRLIIDELSKTVLPLEKQSKVAKKYIELKKELEDIDIALIVKDISDLNAKYSTTKNKIEVLKEQILGLKNTEIEVELEKIKLKNLEIEDKINNKRESLLKITNKLNDLNSEKQITIERQKYEVNNNAINNNLLKLKEQELQLTKNISVIEKDIKDIEESINNERQKVEEVKDKALIIKVKRSNTNTALLDMNKASYMLQNKIEIFENNILNAENTPLSVKNILNNPRLYGIHNTVGKLIEVPADLVIAVDIALGNAVNNIIVDDDEAAINAIEFLKEKKLGRATFYPLNIIKGKYINNEIINDIKNIKGYKGILSELINFEEKYRNIIENLLGQVIVVENANTLNIIGKLINYKYKIVSLDGEIQHAGGSITGGTSKKNNIINEKKELNRLKEELEKLNIQIAAKTKELNNLDEEIAEVEEKEMVLNKYVILLNDELFNKKTAMSRMVEEKKRVTSELSGINDIKEDKLNERIVKLLEEINMTTKEKEILEKEERKLSNERSELNDEIAKLEKKQKESNGNYNNINNEIKNQELIMAKVEVRLDNLLESLSEEYNLTYEYANATYNLEIEDEIAREKVKKIKKEIESLGTVNIGSIEEYERLSKRYDFLNEQKNDLENSSTELHEIINQMDEIMIDKFKTTFEEIKKQFSKIFKLMFRGGNGELKLSNPNDLLNTGIEIIATPPGKKINSPISLSGGEKALTAICLLFAMLQIKPSPFVILDEAEAALDEVNVDMFGKYLKNEKEHSQFIVITHKKRMMEYADCLYGITMQESGVSKIVSAKLEN